MTRRERIQIYWFVIASCAVTVAINWAIGQTTLPADPQPRLKLLGDFDVINFDNGSTWYLRQGTMNAIWAVPRNQQEALGGVKTKIYGIGYEINVPDEVADVLDKVYDAKIFELQDLKQRIQQAKEEVPPGRVTPPN